jgi:glycosyltransferase involved in cell wall biosynthesis
MKFSVLMSIYKKEEPKYFNRAMQSIWDEQTVKPNEIVLVQDGPLTDGLYKAIDEWKTKIGESFKTVPLEKNVGLGEALNAGIKHCSYELIARMDTDDISIPNRFEKQLKVFEEKDIDVCSAWISEFEDDENEILSYRKLPENHQEIIKFSKKRSPLNHIPVMFTKSILLKAGGYKRIMWFEDYYLWARMIQVNAIMYNIQEPLANIRAGCGQLERRSGLKYALSEYTLQKEFLNIGFINKVEFVRNVTIRFISRIMPKVFVKIIYKVLRK